jgi:uncharacterized OB-fold protein
MTRDSYYDIGLGGGRNTLDAQRFWEATADGRFIVQRCGDCGEQTFPPQGHCAYCWSTDLAWEELPGTGRIHTYSEIHVALHESFEEFIPYIVAAISLDEGPYVISLVVESDGADVSLDDPVEVTFRELPGETHQFPVFELAED